MMKLSRACCALLSFVALTSLATAHEGHAGHDKFVKHSFKKEQLSKEFYGEGANFGDFNHDGVNDIVSGPYWYEGPKFLKRHEYYPAKPFDIAGYSENFFAFTHDFNGDGWDDILIIGFPGAETSWFENPQGKEGPWKRHIALAVTDNESPTFTDVTGDGVPDLVCMSGGQIGYAEIPQDPTQLWKFHPVSPVRGYQRFTHGIGVGDVNGDGRLDLLEQNGWWEQPEKVTDEPWAFHEVKFSEPGGSHMFAYDFDGDGDNDVLTAKAAHSYGLAWFEQVKNGDKIEFIEHKIMGEKPEENDYGVAFSQLHAVDLVDMDGDGVLDIVTGKRWWAHAEHDPGSLEPAVLYWFQTVRDNGSARFVPHEIDNNSGVGTQVVARDINGDKLPDVVVGSKKGTFVLTHKAEEVDEAKWNESQPKLRDGVEKPTLPEHAADKKAETAANPDGFPATAADGRRLNLDFEKGDLSDWTATGTAFAELPVEGDTVGKRLVDQTSGQKGQYWIGTYERKGDGPQGELTSIPFKVTHPYASFLVGGGSGKALGAQIVDKQSGEVIFHASGRMTELMSQAAADLSKHLGKEVFIRLIDHGSAGWGHVNFDHFRFHDEKPAIANQPVGELTDDLYPYAGLSGEEAVAAMKLPAGFKAILSAQEPDVKQPIAMALDDRGRLWVAEAYEYPIRAPEGKGTDRILIFEDSDGDGKFDSHKVFADNLNLVSGIELGFGGVWVGAAPYLLFIPDRNGDDVPDGKPEILLDGWAYQDTHETLNTFIWGPDGWLYGCHGVFTHSRIGKPGTPDDKRIPLNGAIWRYHPTQHVFEIFTEGTSNPWGVDFDDNGQAFTTACVIPHLYYNIPGARYQRQAGTHFNPFTYADIQTIADHRHYLGENPHGGNGKSGDAGGGHAHSGAMIYLGGAWPEEYRGRIFMNNIHGQRLNTDILKPQGSGFIGSHGPDFLLTGDLASQILNFRYGPDGNCFLIDWYDTNACHHNNVEGHDRSNGRIYKIVYGEKKAGKVDLGKLSDVELAKLALDKNDWYVRHSRRILQERAAAGKLSVDARNELVSIAKNNADSSRVQRAMWALHVTGGIPSDLAATLLKHQSPYVRGWVIQFTWDGGKTPQRDMVQQFAAMAQQDSSQVVRLYLAAALQHVPLAHRWEILAALTRHAEDADDHNLPLMYWFAAEPLAAENPEQALKFGLSCGKTIPLLRKFMIRRIASIDSPEALATLVQAVAESDNAGEQLELIAGMRTALQGQRQVAQPKSWPAAAAKAAKSSDEKVRREATALGVTFGDKDAMAALRAVVVDGKASDGARRQALDALLRVKDPGLAPVLLKLLADPGLCEPALSGLALYEDAAVPAAVLKIYGNASPGAKRAALATLCSRPGYGVELLKAIEAKQIPAADLSADLVRQLQNHKNADLDELLANVWGQVRSTPADKAAMIVALREMLKHPPATPNVEVGRAVFVKTCQQCHTLYGVGAKIGPDLTGSNRADVEYLLSNVIDPSSVISKDYQQTVILTVDGLVISGLVKAEDDKSVTIQTTTETIVVPQDEIEDRQLSDASMMPEDQLKQFSPQQIASLFAYLQAKGQNPIQAQADNQELFFNGKDLAGWNGNQELWSVEEGELVGRSKNGLAKNEFLFSDFAVGDFELTFQVKLVDDAGNSGVQFRSQPAEGGEAKGYQADIGPDWWGKLYEESGRALLWDKSGEEFVRKGEWNDYKIVAEGSHIRTWINGKPCVDLDDPDGDRRGVFALQLHSGGPTEVRFRNLKLKVLDAPAAAEAEKVTSAE
ncbi:PVC-type heme-binding CxxCH protein [Lacipirellula sp.]|uniref:PVC-type heme-binding CxxCH protein n=1 Tax=Lacipirellula sp. TaxID=2691419 RepID=UPI003D0D4B82